MVVVVAVDGGQDCVGQSLCNRPCVYDHSVTVADVVNEITINVSTHRTSVCVLHIFLLRAAGQCMSPFRIPACAVALVRSTCVL
jgi:hypothetical protein